MKRFSNWVISVVAIVFAVTLIGCESTSTDSAGNKVKKVDKKDIVYYTKYNFHYTEEVGTAKGSVANYTRMKGHKFLPYNSKVKVAKGGDGFYLTDVDNGVRINVLVKSFIKGMTLDEYFTKILSSTPVSYDGLSDVDKDGIKYGRPSMGMTKKGVMIALGYPSPHMTPSIENDTWYY